MTGEKLKEFIRRIEAEGFSYSHKHSYNGTVHGNNGEYADINSEDELLFPREYRKFAMDVCAIRDEVDEYMTAFLAAAPEKDRAANVLDTRTLILFNGHELAARQSSDGAVDFVTWRLDRNGLRDIGHYFDGYTDAKQDFAVRAGLIDRDRLFSETELKVIRSNLSDYLTVDGGDHFSWEQEKDMKDVIDKIDSVIVPVIEEQAREAEDEGYEPESEL